MIDFGKIAVLGKLYKLLQKMLSKYIEKPKMCAKDGNLSKRSNFLHAVDLKTQASYYLRNQISFYFIFTFYCDFLFYQISDFLFIFFFYYQFSDFFHFFVTDCIYFNLIALISTWHCLLVSSFYHTFYSYIL